MRDAVAKVNEVRRDKLTKTKVKYRTLDNEAHKAGKEHHKAVDQGYLDQAEKMLKDAEAAGSRAQLNETNWRNRRASLQALCDSEALESTNHLAEMSNDTADKFAAYNARLQ